MRGEMREEIREEIREETSEEIREERREERREEWGEKSRDELSCSTRGASHQGSVSFHPLIISSSVACHTPGFGLISPTHINSLARSLAHRRRVERGELARDAAVRRLERAREDGKALPEADGVARRQHLGARL